MPESSSRPVQLDHPAVTLAWLLASAASWWCVQPGQLADGLTGFAVMLLLAVIWPALLVCGALRARGGWQLFGCCWIAYALPWLFVLSWVKDVTAAGYPAAIAYSALWPAIFACLLRWLVQQPPVRRLPLSLVAAVTWTGLEYLRAEVILDAWPFHMAGHSQWGGPYTMLASIGGVWLVGMLVVSGGGLLGSALRCRGPWSTWEFALPLLLIILALWTPLPVPLTDQPLTVLAVQTNLPQDNKIGWPLERQAEDVSSFIALTETALASEEPDLVAWPETMVPGLGFEPDTLTLLNDIGPRADAWVRWPRALIAAATRSGVPWLVGSPTWTGVRVQDGLLMPEHRFNSAVLIEPGGELSRADKIFLTPFGETMPYVRSWPWLESLVMDFGASGMQFDLEAAEQPTLLTLDTFDGAMWRLAVPICFEDAVPSVARRQCVRDGRTVADAIINLTNDGWFGSSDAGRRTHAVAAAWRAVEIGRPLLRVANTGYTGVYLPDGTTVIESDPRTATTLLAVLPRYDTQTLQARWGNWVPRLCLLLILIGVACRMVCAPRDTAR